MFTLAHPQHNLVANWFLLCHSCQQNSIFITIGIFIISEIPFCNETGKTDILHTRQFLTFLSPLQNGCWTKHFSLQMGPVKVAICQTAITFFPYSSNNLPTLSFFYKSNRPNILPHPKRNFLLHVQCLQCCLLIFCNLSKSFFPLASKATNFS